MKTTSWIFFFVFGLTVAGCAGEIPGEEEDSFEAELGSPVKYLALGDSVPFGYTRQAAERTPKNPLAFIGYPELYSFFSLTPVTNASCQGETTGSFITATAPDNGCHQWRADGNAMHVRYANAAQSQLAYAQAWLRSHPAAELVTLQIGANDLLLLQNRCTAEAQAAGDPAVFNTCAFSNLGATLQTITQNLGAILSGLRGTGYKGRIVVSNYYHNADYANQDLILLATTLLNQQIGNVVTFVRALGDTNILLADEFTAFATAGNGNPCPAGLIALDPTTGACEIHPSLKGDVVLAKTVLALTSGTP
jgi:lysophospholipase L1-like esterase